MTDARRSFPLLGTAGSCDETLHTAEYVNPYDQPFLLLGVVCNLGLENGRQADLGANIFRVRADGSVDFITLFRRDVYQDATGQADMIQYRQWGVREGWRVEVGESIRVEWFATRVGKFYATPCRYQIDSFADGLLV